jgi:hypothetical protein
MVVNHVILLARSARQWNWSSGILMFISIANRTRRDIHCHHRACARHTAQPVHALRLESPRTIVDARTALWRPANRESPR